jgi:hypothetical protein
MEKEGGGEEIKIKKIFSRLGCADEWICWVLSFCALSRFVSSYICNEFELPCWFVRNTSLKVCCTFLFKMVYINDVMIQAFSIFVINLFCHIGFFYRNVNKFEHYVFRL